MVHASWLKAHGSCLEARGPRLMAKKNLALGPPGPGPSANFSWPWAMSLEAWAMKINNRWINELCNSKFQNSKIPRFGNSKIPKTKDSKITRLQASRTSRLAKCQMSTSQNFKVPKFQGLKVPQFQSSKVSFPRTSLNKTIRFPMFVTIKQQLMDTDFQHFWFSIFRNFGTYYVSTLVWQILVFVGVILQKRKEPKSWH